MNSANKVVLAGVEITGSQADDRNNAGVVAMNKGIFLRLAIVFFAITGIMLGSKFDGVVGLVVILSGFILIVIVALYSVTVVSDRVLEAQALIDAYYRGIRGS